MDKQYTYTKEESKDKGTKLNIKVASAKFMAAKEKMFTKLSQDVTLAGFRPGKAPKALMEAHISDKVYNETINHLLPEITAEILDTEKLNPMNQVQYEIVKMSDADGIEFKVSFINYPEINLGDFSKIKVKKEEKKIEDKDVKAEIEKIMKYYSKKVEAKPETAAKVEEKVEVTDENVKNLGIGFNNVKELEEQVKKELEVVTARETEAKWLQQILNEAIKLSRIEPPQAFVNESIASREKDYLKKLEELNLKQEDFLKMQNTSMDKLHKEWADEAKKKFSEELLLLEIIKKQNLIVNNSDIDAEVAKVTDPKLKTDLETPEGKRYLVTVLLQQKAIEWLRAQVQK